MGKLNRGLIYTNENCIGCDRCISECPVLGANISVVEDGKKRINVDGDKCIHCGHCMVTCPHNARAYRDDTEQFFYDLSQGEKISILVAPSFYINYPDTYKQILGYLRELGAEFIYDISYGADITTWSYLRYIEKNGMQGGISQPCPAVVNYIVKYEPELISKIMPIQSPLMCMAIYLHKYVGDTNKMAFISPCIAKKDEIDDVNTYGNVKYNVTFNKLLESLGGIALSNYSYEDENIELGLGATYPEAGGLKENLENFISQDAFIRQINGVNKVYPYLKEYEHRIEEGKALPYLVDALNCSQGCSYGTATKAGFICEDNVMMALQKRRNEAKRENSANPFAQFASMEVKKQRLYARFQELKLDDFIRLYDDVHITETPIIQAKIDSVFASLYKYTKEDKEINCRSCGYNSCEDMAKAIARGYNQKENCVHYMKDENLRLFSTDILTEIPNLNAFNRYVDELLENGVAHQFSVVYLNMRNFKIINRNFGSKTGDLALHEFAQITASYADAYEMVARISGDNFVGVFYDEHLENVLAMISNVILHINDSKGIMAYPVTSRIGVYSMDGKEKLAGEVFGRVTMAYAATDRAGDKRIVHYNDELNTQIMHEIEVERLLQPALDNKEFVVYYQPKVRMADKRLVGAEALVRWKWNGRVVPPIEFIPISEGSGFVCKIDFYVFEETCRQMRAWLDSGYDMIRVSVNFSKQHFVADDVADRIKEVADKYQIPHKFIEIEVTETAYIDEYDNLVSTINKLKEQGFYSSIDDFGTGYSSLNLLQNMNFDTLKLDKSFLGEKCKDVRTQLLIANIIKMAKDLDMDIIAEGVETMDELKLLNDLYCDTAQGFLFDPPLPAGEFAKRLAMKTYMVQ